MLRETLGTAELDAIVARLRCAEDDEVRAWSLRTLGGIGPLAASQSAAVAASLAEEGTRALTPPTRGLAVAALAAFGQPSVGAHLAAIGALLADEEACVRAAAIEALGQVGDAGSHAEAVSELLYDSDRSVRSAAAVALKRWGVA